MVPVERAAKNPSITNVCSNFHPTKIEYPKRIPAGLARACIMKWIIIDLLVALIAKNFMPTQKRDVTEWIIIAMVRNHTLEAFLCCKPIAIPKNLK